MAIGILAKKVGMTRVYDQDGKEIPVTVLEAGPCQVIQIKTADTDGYSSVQLGFDDQKETRVTKPLLGHFKKAKAAPKKFLREIRVEADDEFSVGETITVDEFEPGDKITITGTSKGKGFQGGMKRHGWSGGRKSHGSMFHRRPGSIGGGSSDPSRVFKGHPMPGQMGAEQITVDNVELVKVDIDNNLLVVKGSVPGSANGYLIIVKDGKHVAKAAEQPAEDTAADNRPAEDKADNKPDVENASDSAAEENTKEEANQNQEG